MRAWVPGNQQAGEDDAEDRAGLAGAAAGLEQHELVAQLAGRQRLEGQAEGDLGRGHRPSIAQQRCMGLVGWSSFHTRKNSPAV
jgi:hypothetical protein